MVQSDREPKHEGFVLFEVWKEYERVAMHFNELLIRLRTQSVAAVATVVTLAGVLLKGDSISYELRWGTLAVVSLVLCALWIAVWILDFTYYNRLLLGAVHTLREIEKASTKANVLHEITLSTSIEARVGTWRRPSDEDWHKAVGRWTFYLIVFVVLLTGVWVCVERLGGLSKAYQAVTGRPSQAARSPDVPRLGPAGR
jgi:hypothetical protein